MSENRCLDSDVKDFNGFIVKECDTPVLNICDTPYKNVLLIRNFPQDKSRLDILMELKHKLKLVKQTSNVFGFFIIEEIGNTSGNSSVVLLIRSIKRFKRDLNMSSSHARNFYNISILDYWVEVMDIKDAGYSLAYLMDDGFTHQSIPLHKLMMFDNAEELDLFSVTKMLDCIVDSHELMSIVATKKKVFLTLVSNEVEAEVLKSLIINFGSDFNMRICDRKLILIKRGLSPESAYNGGLRSGIKIVVDM